MLMSLDPLYALLVIVVLVLPYLIWLIRADALAHAALARDRRSRRARAALGLAARRPGAGDVRHRAAGDPQLRLVRPQRRRKRRSSTGRRSIRWRATSSISSPSRPALLGSLIAGPVQSRPRRRRRRRCAADVGACRDRRDRRSDPSAASARAAHGLGRGASSRPPCVAIATTLFLPWTGSGRSADLAAGESDRAVSSATVSSGAPISGCARWPAIRNWRA